MFWSWLAGFIIRHRLFLLILIGILTAFLGWEARNVQVSYDYLSILPKKDPELEYFNKFKKTFGDEGNIIVIGCKDSSLFKLSKFKAYIALKDSLANVPGVKEVISIPNLKYLIKDTANKKFVLTTLQTDNIYKQEQLDSLLGFLKKLKFYHYQLYNPQNGAVLLALAIDNDYITSIRRLGLIKKIQEHTAKFQNISQIKLHIGGIPYIRSVMSIELQKELSFFLIVSILVCSVTLFIFFKTWDAVFIPLILIAIIITWTFGTLALLKYKITILTGLIPSLIVITSIPNFIYLINKYHQEFGLHQNKLKAIAQIIRSIGVVTFMVNATTAIGFLVLISNNVSLLKEFGLVAGLNIMASYVITIITVPSILVYMPEPTVKKIKHLDSQYLNVIIKWSLSSVFNFKKYVYVFYSLLFVISVIGMLKLKTLSYMTDDVPEKLGIIEDLKFFESNFKGIMPLELVIDTRKKKALMNLKNLKVIDEFEQYLQSLPHVSPPLSVNTFIKSSLQVFYGGDPNYFRLPNNQEKPFVMSYLKNMDNDKNKKGLLNSFVDSSGQQLRLSCKVSDMGSLKIDSLLNFAIIPKAESLFKSYSFDYKITGSTLLFVRGNNLLINSLYSSIIQSIAFCSILMAMLFASFRMILITLIQNFIPIMFTAAIMGFFGIHLKPSTAIIFSVVFGIAVDNSIHFLAKYRHEILRKKIAVEEALRISLIEAGPSMIYTSTILFLGFIIFMFSSFGGTFYLGLLISITLLTTLVASLTLLPSLILDFDKERSKKDFSQLIENFEGFYVEEDKDDVDISNLNLRKDNNFDKS